MENVHAIDRQNELTIDALRDQRDRLRLEAEIREEQARLNELESPGRSNFLNSLRFEAEASRPAVESSLPAYQDPWWWRDERQYLSGVNAGFIPNRTGDREGGSMQPFLSSEADLDNIRAIARYLCGENKYAIGAMANLKNFVVAGGFQYTATTKDRDVIGRNLLVEVQDVIDEFFRVNRWKVGRERENFERSRRDGEVFSRLYYGNKQHYEHFGVPLVRTIEPEFVTEPSNPGALVSMIRAKEPTLLDDPEAPQCFRWGVHTPAADTEDEIGYYIDWKTADMGWRYMPASILHHSKVNVDLNVKRGLSDFFANRQSLFAAERLLTRIGDGASLQAAIALLVEHLPGTSGTAVSNQIRDKAQYEQNKSGASGVQTEYFIDYGTGRVVNIPNGKKYHPGPMGTNQGPVYLDVLQGILRATGVRWAMPEYMISGDASNANYASTLESGSPWRKSIESLQSAFGSDTVELLWKVLKIAYVHGRFDAMFPGLRWSTLRRYVEIQARGVQPEVIDRKAETERRQILKQNGVVSRVTWAGEEGYDAEQEFSNGAVDEMSGAAAVGSAPIQPGETTAPEADPNEVIQDAPPEAKTAAAESLAVALRRAARETDKRPTDRQRESGNYTMGVFPWHGMPIKIEVPRGFYRRGYSPDGKPWARRLSNHYGYFAGTRTEADGEPLDVWIGPHIDSELVFVVDQVDQSGEFDEHKAMIGFIRKEDAVAAYLANYPAGWKTGPVRAMSLDDFKSWVRGMKSSGAGDAVHEASRAAAESMVDRAELEAIGAELSELRQVSDYWRNPKTGEFYP